MQKIKRNTLLKYIPNIFDVEKNINPARIVKITTSKTQGENIIYLCEREIRAKDNFALQFAIQKSKELNLPLRIIHPKINYKNKQKEIFINSQIAQVQNIFLKYNIDFSIIEASSTKKYIKNLNPEMLITDFNPINKKTWLKKMQYQVYEIDSHNIIPARLISNKQEYNARTLRKKIYFNIYNFLTEFDNFNKEKTEADIFLDEFIKNKLPYYAEFKNHPDKNITSELSKYISLGFISSQRIAIEIIKSQTTLENKETFLEELIVRKELSENFCLYTPSFKNFVGIPIWAKESLNTHKRDLRTYLYETKELENAKTHDRLWNATQLQLKNEGKIQGYLRMYWAKKIAEWSSTPENALKITIYLNDKYAFDAPSPNGYTGILWAIAGLHDRPFKDYPITGKIRRMTYDSIKKKYNITDYIKKYLDK